MNPDFSKYPDQLMPAIIQDSTTRQVLMLGYMNPEAFTRTKKEGTVTFYSRSRRQLWTKGASSGNYFTVRELFTDCDNDCLLILAAPSGPACHTGETSCFGPEYRPKDFLYILERIIEERMQQPRADSYTASLFREGINRIAQKLGEEAVELIIEAKDDHDERFIGEAADLLYHLLVLLQAKKISLAEVSDELARRHNLR
jgi:phosphoribosyl-ATP pyrophosphohydrolase/phosphoribosyl-AMP cyclohydrolase